MEYPFVVINQIEEKICADEFFRIALGIGNVRVGHEEGKLRYHIIHILEYIENYYKEDDDYAKLRWIALLHDMGKLGELVDNTDKYLPQDEQEQETYLAYSQKFIEEMGKQPDDGYSPAHALYSFEFAKRFVADDDILDTIKFHDTAFRLQKLQQKQGDVSKHIKHIFTHLNNKLMLKFMAADNAKRGSQIVSWLKQQLVNADIHEM